MVTREEIESMSPEEIGLLLGWPEADVRKTIEEAASRRWVLPVLEAAKERSDRFESALHWCWSELGSVKDSYAKSTLVTNLKDRIGAALKLGSYKPRVHTDLSEPRCICDEAGESICSVHPDPSKTADQQGTFDKDEAQSNLDEHVGETLRGLWRHYKGGLYVVFSESVNEATGDLLVHYYSVEKRTRWTRTIRNFQEEVKVGLGLPPMKRFEKLRHSPEAELTQAAFDSEER